MQWLRQGLALLLGIVAVAVGALFSLHNTQAAPLDLILCLDRALCGSMVGPAQGGDDSPAEEATGSVAVSD